MSMNINVDQHRLYTSPEGHLIAGSNGGFLIYDILENVTIELPMEEAPVVISHLGHLPAVTNSVVVETAMNGESASAASSNESEPMKEEIWLKNSGKQSALDLQARDELIGLVGSEKYQRLFADKRTTKKKVWEEIAQIMLNKYSFGERNAATVCSQKWRNMESTTLTVLAAAGPKNSGGAHVKKPSYFDDIHDIVKDKAKAVPKNLVDSMATASPSAKALEEDEEKDEEEEEQKADSSSPFLKVQTSSKPKTKVSNLDILNFLQKEAEEKNRQHEEQLEFFRKKAKKDDKRKKDLIAVLSASLSKKKKKKGAADKNEKNESSSEESSSSESDSSDEERKRKKRK